MTPKVSVLMSVYNGRQYLEASLNSVSSQTFSDFEFLVIDDGSTDGSLPIIEAYAYKDARIKLVKNEINIGLTKSLNKGLHIARGKYIARQDVDDISLPHRLASQIQFLDTHPEVGALGSAVQAIDEAGNPIHSKEDLESPFTTHDTIQAYLLINNCLWHSSMMMQTELVRNTGGYNESLRYSQDYDLWWRLSKSKRLTNFPDALVQIRQSAGSITQKKREQQLDCAYQTSLRIFRELIGTESLNEAAYRRFWWTTLLELDNSDYKNLWLKKQGKKGLLTAKDIENLVPVWETLSKFNSASAVWGSFFLCLSQKLLYEQQISAGFRLLSIAKHYLEADIRWYQASRSFIKPYVEPLLRVFE